MLRVSGKIALFICLFIYWFVCLFICLFACLFICLFVYYIIDIAYAIFPAKTILLMVQRETSMVNIVNSAGFPLRTHTYYSLIQCTSFKGVYHRTDRHWNANKSNKIKWISIFPCAPYGLHLNLQMPKLNGQSCAGNRPCCLLIRWYKRHQSMQLLQH